MVPDRTQTGAEPEWEWIIPMGSEGTLERVLEEGAFELGFAEERFQETSQKPQRKGKGWEVSGPVTGITRV